MQSLNLSLGCFDLMRANWEMTASTDRLGILIAVLEAQELSGGKQICGAVMRQTQNSTAPHGIIPLMKGCCSIPKARSNSSNRIKAAVMAGMQRDADRKGLVKKMRSSKIKKKKNRLMTRFVECPQVPDRIYRWTEKQLLEEYCLVIDGSAEGNNTCFRPEHCKKEWRCCSIKQGQLFVPGLPPPHLGLVHPMSSRSCSAGPPPYRLLPRKDALKSTHLLMSQQRVNKLCSALDAFEKVQRGSLKRGISIFGHNKYICAGTQPCRASAGVRDTYHVSKVNETHLDTVVSYVRNLERLFEAFAESEVLLMVQEARKLLNYRTLRGAGRQCEIFGAFAFGRNVYLPSHKDKDFTYSIISVHVRDGYYSEADNNVVAYFCFPRLGVAVPLRPGDVLIINPLEPHSVSSRCYESHEVFCFSAYLKSSNVGLNDNKLELCPEEKTLAQEYCKCNK